MAGQSAMNESLSEIGRVDMVMEQGSDMKGEIVVTI